MSQGVRAYLELTCLSDVAVSARAASVGGHDVLPYLPGSQLLGAAAARLYDRLLETDREACWRIFHGAALRFGAAYPVRSVRAVSYPVPLSWHHDKHVDPGGARLHAERIVNLSARDVERRPRMKQLREGYVDPYGALVQPLIRESLRTAVDPRSGRARTGLLYEVNALREGTRLLARIDADDELVLEPVLEALLAEGELLIGRSRHAELGLVRVRRLDEAPRGFACEAEPPRDEALFWCVSDLAWRDVATGQPRLVPPPQAFGLPSSWRFAPERSFVRTRSYSPFNGHRRRPDLERQVLVAGSVLVYAGDPPCEPERVRKAIAPGVGAWREEGLGRVIYAPRCLGAAQPVFLVERSELTEADAKGALASGASVRSPLCAWLEREQERERRSSAAWQQALRWRDEVARSPAWRALAPSQWFALGQAIARAPGRPLEAFERFTGSSMRKLPDRWGARDPDKGYTLAKWLADEVALAQVSETLGPDGTAMALLELARLAPRATRQRSERAMTRAEA